MNEYFNFEINGLGTFTQTLTVAGNYSIDCKVSLPIDPTGVNVSGLVITINQNSTTVQTSSPGSSGCACGILAAAGDVISIITSSSASADQGLNTIKGTVTINQDLVPYNSTNSA